MNTLEKRMAALTQLRLPELQQAFLDIVGEPTRAPNKKYLLRRIREALETQAEQAIEAVAPSEAPEADADAHQVEQAPAPVPTNLNCGAKRSSFTNEPGGPSVQDLERSEKKLSKLSVEALQAKYIEVVGRSTGSSDRRYLIWKIREAQKGRIPVGPVRRGRPRDGEERAMKVLPLRMETTIVARLDEARERLGLPSRMELFRRALSDYLTAAGEHEVAQLFAEQA